MTESSSMNYGRWKEVLGPERLPAAIVDLDAFDRNARKLSDLVLASGKNLRIATKSIRVPQLIWRALASGAPYRGVMCYSAEEALFLATHPGDAEGNGGFIDDILVAYPSLQNSDLNALRELHHRGKTVCQVVDDPAHLAALARVVQGAKDPLRVVIEVDMSLRIGGAHLGVRRSPIRTTKRLASLLEEARKYPMIRVVGVMGYEAQVAGLVDRNPFKKLLNPVASLVRKLSIPMIAARRREVLLAFEKRGLAMELFNGGGTGSLTYALREKPLTEVTAGSALYSPHLFDYYSNIAFEPSCFFAVQAVRSSDPGFVTCQGGGYIASGEPGWDRVPVPYLPENLRLVSTEGAGEVQTPVRFAKNALVRLGDPVLFRHTKAGELMERFNEVLLVSGGKIVGRAKTYRGLGLSFF